MFKPLYIYCTCNFTVKVCLHYNYVRFTEQFIFFLWLIFSCSCRCFASPSGSNNGFQLGVHYKQQTSPQTDILFFNVVHIAMHESHEVVYLWGRNSYSSRKTHMYNMYKAICMHTLLFTALHNTSKKNLI